MTILYRATAIAATLAMAGCAGSSAAQAEGVTVSVAGRPGRVVATLDEALAAARTLRASDPGKAIVIDLPAGTLRLTAPITLTTADSGTAGAPLIIQGAADGSSVITGGRIVAPASRAAVVVSRAALPAAAAFKAFGYDEKIGGVLGDRGYPLLLQDGRRIELTRWPDKGYATDWRATAGKDGVTLANPRLPAMPDGNVLVAGYYGYPWAFQAFPARVAGATVKAAGFASSVPMMAKAPLRLLNVDRTPAPGEMHIADDGAVTVMPRDPAKPIELAAVPTLLTFMRATDIVVRRIALQESAGTVVRMYEANRIALSDCFVGAAGGFGIEADGGSDVTIDRCVVGGTGLGGIRINGGDRTTLTPGGHHLRDSVVQDTGLDVHSSLAAIAMSGVGNDVSDSLIQNAPHTAIQIDGNDHLVARNEIRFAVCETDDAGAIYMGRDWTQRGNRVVGNFIHDIAPSTGATVSMGVYLDDQFSGAEIAGNTMLRVGHGIRLGGGRDTIIRDNNFALTRQTAILYDSRGTSDQQAMAAPGGLLRTLLDKSPYRTALWQRRYPTLATLLDNAPGSPVGNIATGNRVADGPFLWTAPMDLTLPGRDNVALNFKPMQGVGLVTSTYADQFKVLTSGLRPGSSLAMPGLRQRLLFANRIAPAGCR